MRLTSLVDRILCGKPRTLFRDAVARAKFAMTKILVDGVEVDVPPELTLLQACEAAGAEKPH